MQNQTIKTPQTWSVRIDWSGWKGEKEAITLTGDPGEPLESVRKKAVDHATELGWTPPRWWQFWRWADTQIEVSI